MANGKARHNDDRVRENAVPTTGMPSKPEVMVRVLNAAKPRQMGQVRVEVGGAING